jgi:hypothetical protein
MSATLKSLDRLKNYECKKGQLSNWPPILYVAEMNIITPKEDPQVFKVKLPDDSHINMHIYSHGNTKEYLTHIVVVLCIIKQKGLDARCRELKKAVLRQSRMLKNLLEPLGQGTLSQRMLMFRPARWRLSRPNSCSKISRRLMTRQLLKSTSS